jgi:integrase
LFRLLILTGARKSEVGEAHWNEFDLPKRMWTIPSARMKMAAPHVVPITDDMVTVLERLPRFACGDCLFSTSFGAKPVDGFSQAKVRLDRRMLHTLRAMARARGEDPTSVKLEHFVIHDIRRTMRTRLSGLPIEDRVREMMIAHAAPGMHRIYDQHKYLLEKQRGFQLWNDMLRSIVNPAPPADNVVALRGK